MANKIKTCGKETRYYTKYKWYSKKWETKICGVTSGYVCEFCEAYNQGYRDALVSNGGQNGD